MRTDLADTRYICDQDNLAAWNSATKQTLSESKHACFPYHRCSFLQHAVMCRHTCALPAAAPSVSSAAACAWVRLRPACATGSATPLICATRLSDKPRWSTTCDTVCARVPYQCNFIHRCHGTVQCPVCWHRTVLASAVGHRPCHSNSAHPRSLAGASCMRR
jgi:hypothetical protein